MLALRGWSFACAIGAAALAAFSTVQSASAFSVDFSNVPGATASDGLAINTQYEASDDVVFSLQGGGSPILVQTGDTTGPIGFLLGPHGADPNTLAPGQNVGNFFLTDDGVLGPPHNLLMNFTTPMSEVQGDILDIDHTDGWTISAIAIGSSDNVVDQVVLDTSSPDTGSGIATPFTLTSTTDNISEVLLDMTSHGAAPGFGWANFSFSANLAASVQTPAPSVPLPAAFWQGGVTLAALGAIGLIRRKSPVPVQV